MIEINLLPGASKRKASARQAIDFAALGQKLSGSVKDKVLIGSVAAVVVAVLAGAFLYFSQAKRESDLTAHAEQAARDSTRYATLLSSRYRAEASRDSLLRQVNIIHSLDEDRFVWPHIMDEVSRALPQYTWLTLLGFVGTPQGQNNVVITPKIDTTKKGKAAKRLDTEIPLDAIQVRITGRTVDIQALTRFMTDLEASPFLSNVQLDRSELASDQGKQVTQFQLTLSYERPDTSMLHMVPISTSVRADAGGERRTGPAGGY
jgi:Tfp pilus assembly protein PilN